MLVTYYIHTFIFVHKNKGLQHSDSGLIVIFCHELRQNINVKGNKIPCVAWLNFVFKGEGFVCL